MSDRTKDIPTPPPADTPPEPYDVVVRRTWAVRFNDPAVPASLETVGQMLTEVHQEAGRWGTTGGRGVVRAGLAAVAEDLASLADFLAIEIARAPQEYKLTREEVELATGAGLWRERILAVVQAINEDLAS